MLHISSSTERCMAADLGLREAYSSASSGLTARDAICSVLSEPFREKSRWAVIHAPTAAFGLTHTGRFAREQGKQLPEGFIAGTVGAGDAFCTGVLLAAYRGLSIEEALRCGNASAIQSLKADTPNGSMISIEESLAAYDALPFRA